MYADQMRTGLKCPELIADSLGEAWIPFHEIVYSFF